MVAPAGIKLELLVIYALLGHVLACPNGWTTYNRSCYIFKDHKLSWHKAQEHCQNIDGHLARVESRDENNFLLQSLRDRHFLDNKVNYGYWIDGNDIAVENDWEWEGNHRITFFDWGPGEPNSGGGQEDCLGMYGGLNFHWNDSPCSYSWEFICELEDYVDPAVG